MSMYVLKVLYTYVRTKTLGKLSEIYYLLYVGNGWAEVREQGLLKPGFNLPFIHLFVRTELAS